MLFLNFFVVVDKSNIEPFNHISKHLSIIIQSFFKLFHNCLIINKTFFNLFLKIHKNPPKKATSFHRWPNTYKPKKKTCGYSLNRCHAYFFDSQNAAQMATACLRFLAVPFLITAGMQRAMNLTFVSCFFGAGIWFV